MVAVEANIDLYQAQREKIISSVNTNDPIAISLIFDTFNKRAIISKLAPYAAEITLSSAARGASTGSVFENFWVGIKDAFSRVLVGTFTNLLAGKVKVEKVAYDKAANALALGTALVEITSTARDLSRSSLPNLQPYQSLAISLGLTQAANSEGSPISKFQFDESNLLTGQPVTADSLGSIHPDSLPLSYSWTLFRPAGSNSSLSSTNDSKMSFVPDISGSYSLSLTLSAGQQSSTVTQSVSVKGRREEQIFVSPEAWEIVDKFISENQCGDVIQLGSVTLGPGEYWDEPKMWATTYSEGEKEHVYLMASENVKPSAEGEAMERFDQFDLTSEKNFDSDFLMDMYEGASTNSGTYTHAKEWRRLLAPGDTVYFAVGVASNRLVEIRQIVVETKILKDLDGDGVANDNDRFPSDGTEWEDTDADGIGDNAGEFPNDVAASEDSDGGLLS